MIANEKLKDHVFLAPMLKDKYYPEALVQKGAAILRDLCLSIEREKPGDLASLYALTHAATRKFNSLEGEFLDQGSEIETVAREAIAQEFENIAVAYGIEADVEEMIAPRNW
jgi:hypothetical protein